MLAIAITAVMALVATAPVAFAAEPGGTATASNSLLRVAVGSTINVEIGKDSAQSLWGTTRSATAEIDFGKAGTTKIEGGAKRSTDTRAESGTQRIGTGKKSVNGLVSFTVTGGSITTDLSPTLVKSSADFSVASIDLLTGFISFATGTTSTATRIEATKASVSRSLSLGTAKLLAIGDLLDRLDIDPLALACGAVEGAGAELGVNTSAACEEFGAAEAAIDAGQAALADARGDLAATLSGFTLEQVQADEAAVEALSCDPGDAVCQAAALVTMVSLNSTGGYGVDLTGLGFDEAKTAMLARLAELQEDFSDLSAMDEGIAKASSSTCADVKEALADVSAAAPDQAATLNPLAAGVGDACDALADTVNELLGTPLLSLGAVRVGLETTAAVDAPVAKVTGTVGSLKVGTLSPVGQTIDLSKTGLAQTVATVRTAIAEVLAALGIDFPTPELDIMKTATSKGKRSDGTWYANASLTALHLGIPSVTVTLPDANPLALLGGTGGFALPAGGAGIAAQHTTPRVDVDAARFSGASTFIPGSDGRTLPITGVEDAALLAMLFVVAAVAVRRFILVRD